MTNEPPKKNYYQNTDGPMCQMDEAVLEYHQIREKIEAFQKQCNEQMQPLVDMRKEAIWQVWELSSRNAIVASQYLGITSSVVSRVIREKAGGKSPRGGRRKLKKLDSETAEASL